MKRQILFRGYSESLNKWVEGDLIQGNDELFKAILPIENQDMFEYFTVHPDSVGQFTGLCDMEGNKVFEGDVLKVGENLTCEVVYIGTNSDDYGDEINASFHAKIHQHDKIIPLDGYLKKYCKITGNTFQPE
jgi:uncharacterized phage protein (TIGR01671 family)